MIGQMILNYKILEKLGEGGMGVVYKALDTKLDRPVALKFLPSHNTVCEENRARFLQEAKAASAVIHPSVCVIHDIAEHENQLFIVMEFVDGKTVRQLIPLKKIQDAIGYAVQIGEALEEAHSKRIVHRDVKTDNIMVNTRNQIKVMDFGLAKLKGSLKLTKTSSTKGTLGYMAPEQIQGGEVDARSDIFSFGVVLYEMLTGKLPFRGEHEAAMMYSIVNEEPIPVEKFVPDISSELIHVLNRALEKDPEERYQNVHEMLIDLRRLKKETSRVVRRALDESHQMDSDVPVTKRTSTYWRWIIACAFVAFFAVGMFVIFQKKEKIHSLAVLPFVNVAVDPDVEYLSDGITESIINSLSRLRSLRVVPRSTVFRYKGKDMDATDAARDLNVQALLTGKVVKREDDLVLQIELVDAVRQSQIWGEHYTRKVEDLVDVQKDIVNQVTNRLELRLTGEENERLSHNVTSSKEAYQLFLMGRYQWNKRSEEGTRKSVECFEKAIEKDPLYAMAYVGLADAYIILGDWKVLPPKESYPKARTAAQKALHIDDRLGEAHTSRAMVAFEYGWNWKEAEKEFKRALELNPTYATAHQWYSEFLASQGRLDEAMKEILRAQELDPLSLIISAEIGYVYYCYRNYDQSIEQCRKILEMEPDFLPAHYLLFSAYLMKKMNNNFFKEILAVRTLEGGSKRDMDEAESAYRKSGVEGFTLWNIEYFKRLKKDRYIDPIDFSYLYNTLGNKDSTFAWLDRAYKNRSRNLVYIIAHPEFETIKADPRFVALVRKVGLER
jgi:serine/threonine protein kinase/tetratricopeptide (TPR) repeat protein